jgi:hypothetical protein
VTGTECGRIESALIFEIYSLYDIRFRHNTAVVALKESTPLLTVLFFHWNLAWT